MEEWKNPCLQDIKYAKKQLKYFFNKPKWWEVNKSCMFGDEPFRLRLRKSWMESLRFYIKMKVTLYEEQKECLRDYGVNSKMEAIGVILNKLLT